MIHHHHHHIRAQIIPQDSLKSMSNQQLNVEDLLSCTDFFQSQRNTLANYQMLTSLHQRLQALTFASDI